MSKWRYGCGKSMTVLIPHGMTYRERTVECGSTAHDGGVNQCSVCALKHPVSMPTEDEDDLSWAERQEDY